MFREDVKFGVLPQHFDCLRIAEQELEGLYDEGHMRLNSSEITEIVKHMVDEYFTVERIIGELNAYLRKCEVYLRYKLLDGKDIVLVKYDEDRMYTPRFKVNMYGIHPKHKEDIKLVTHVSEEELRKTFYGLAFTWLYTRVQSHMKDIMFKKCLRLDEDKELGWMDDQWIIKGSYDELVDTYLCLSAQ